MTSDVHRPLDVWALVSIGAFYILIAIVGVVAARVSNRRRDRTQKASENAIVGGRDIGAFVGCMTMIATWVGGGFINGTAQVVYEQGIVHAQATIGYALSLVVGTLPALSMMLPLGGLVFARPMRAAGYVTMIDPFQLKYGRAIGSLMFVPALCGELLWSSAILRALGSTIYLVLGLDMHWSIIISAAFAVFYTFTGGLYSVAYTDVVQLVCIAVGLVVCVPFAWSNAHSMVVDVDVFSRDDRWLGAVDSHAIGTYIDSFLLLIFGGIPWQVGTYSTPVECKQVYFQRVLSAPSACRAQVLSLVAAVGCMLMSIPPVLVGIIGQNANWSAVLPDGADRPEQPDLILPYVIAYLTPYAVGIVGLGVVSAAVMSSSDSSILSAASMFSHNIVKGAVYPEAGDTVRTHLKCINSVQFVLWVLRASIIGMGVAACAIAITAESVYALWYLSSDLVYVMLFPQLVLVLFVGRTSRLGVLAGFLVALILRALLGVPEIGIPALVAPNGLVPFKTLVMLGNLVVTTIVSLILPRRPTDNRVRDLPMKALSSSPHSTRYSTDF